jgi:FSR family fosmidomycin resistance protein-like MFS transporter
MSFYMVGGEIARTIGPLMVTAGVSLWGLEGTYRLMPLGIVASMILYFRLKNFTFTQKKFTKKAEKGSAMAEVKRLAPLLGVMGGFLFFQSAMKMATTLYLAVYLTQEGFSLWYASIALSVLQLFGVVGTFLSRNISDKIGRQKTLVMMSSAAAITMLLFVMSSNFYVLFILLAFLGVFMFSNGPIMLSIIHEVETKMPIFVNSVYMTVNFSISSIVVFLMGAFGDKMGLTLTYEVASALAFCAIPFALSLNSAIKKIALKK